MYATRSERKLEKEPEHKRVSAFKGTIEHERGPLRAYQAVHCEVQKPMYARKHIIY